METTEKTGNKNPQPAPTVVGKATPLPATAPPEEKGKIAQLFSKGLSKKEVRKIAREEAEKVLDENMGIIKKLFRGTKETPDTKIVSKEFRNANADELDRDVSEWLSKVHAVKVDHTEQSKDPLSNFGMVKTVYAVVLKGAEDEEDADEE
jgi:hypothetical protein